MNFQTSVFKKMEMTYKMMCMCCDLFVQKGE
jgi:hypothetical protein